MPHPYEATQSKVPVDLPEVPVPLHVPRLMADSLRFIQSYGLVEGILRISGSVRRINKLYDGDSLDWFKEPHPLPHDISGVLKRSLRNFDNTDVQGAIDFSLLIGEFNRWKYGEKLPEEPERKHMSNIAESEEEEPMEEKNMAVEADNKPEANDNMQEERDNRGEEDQKAVTPKNAGARSDGAEGSQLQADVVASSPVVSADVAVGTTPDLESVVLINGVNFYRHFATYVCSKWSQTRLHIFVFMVAQLHQLLAQEEKTKMPSSNLSIIFQPYLLNCDSIEFMPLLQIILQTIIEEYPLFIECVPLYTFESSTSIVSQMSQESMVSRESPASSTDSVHSSHTSNTLPLREHPVKIEDFKRKLNRFSFFIESASSPISKRFSMDYFSRSKSTSEPMELSQRSQLLLLPANSVSLDQVPQLRQQAPKQQKRKSFMSIFGLPYILIDEAPQPEVEPAAPQTRSSSGGLRESLIKRAFSLKSRPSVKQRHTDRV